MTINNLIDFYKTKRKKMTLKNSLTLGVSFILGICLAAGIFSKSLIDFKNFDRTVKVKGLSEKEVEADLVIWPIKFSFAANNSAEVFSSLENVQNEIIAFLKNEGFNDDEITLFVPSVTDNYTLSYVETSKIKFRFIGENKIVLYSSNIKKAQNAMKKIADFGKKGINFIHDYDSKIEYLYTNLNKIKPKMIEQATKNARETALKFAQDSNSKLGKIKNASQGQFSISSRDKNTEYIKKIRVVSTIEYFLDD